MHRLILPLLLVVVLGYAMALPQQSVQANYFVQITFDDPQNDLPWTFGGQGSPAYGVLGAGETGQGVISEFPANSSFVDDCCTSLVVIVIDLQGCIPTQMAWRMKHTDGRWLITTVYDDAGTVLAHASSFLNNAQDWSYTMPPGGWLPSEPEEIAQVDTMRLVVGSPYDGTIQIDSISIDCLGDPPGLVRPFSLADEYVPTPPLTDPQMTDYNGFLTCPSWFLITPFTSCSTVAAQSKTPNAPVLAAADGEIVDIVPFAGSDYCKKAPGIEQYFEDDQCFFFLPNPDPTAAADGYVTGATPNAAVVILGINDNTDFIFYIVDNPQKYVHIGLRIEAGCILGEALSRSFVIDTIKGPLASFVGFLQGYLGFLVNLILQQPGGTAGVTFMWRSSDGFLDNADPLINDLTEYRTPDKACNLDPEVESCLTNNPRLAAGDNWTAFGQVTWLPSSGGAMLAPGASVSQTLNLADTTYTVKALVNPVFSGTPNHKFQLQLGTLQDEYTIDGSGIGGTVYQLTGDPDPDYGGLAYTVRLINTGTSNIIVKYICVDPGDTSEPTSCTFTNPTFNSDLSGWDTSGPTVTWRQGSAYIPIDEHIQQGTPLPVGAYTITFDVRIAFDPAYTSGGAVSVNLYRPDGTSSNHPLTINWNAIGQPGYPITPETITVTFNIAAPASGFIRFEPIFDTPATGITGIFLDRACLYLTSQGPGQGGGQCARPSAPISADVGAWTAWHWANLERFFTCELMILLNNQFDFLQTSVNTGLMAVRWFMATINYTTTWFGEDMLPWLNGHFRNMAVGQVTTINQQSGAGLWDVLLAIVGIFRDAMNVFNQTILSLIPTLIGLIYNIAQIFFTLLLGAVSFILALLTRMADLLSLATSLLSTIITAYNTAQPIPIPLLPQCSTVDPRTNAVCIVFWILDNTIFSGIGATFVPLLISILSIHLILDIVIDIRKTVLELGKVS
jgi:hypothetical protein